MVGPEKDTAEIEMEGAVGGGGGGEEGEGGWGGGGGAAVKCSKGIGSI